MSGGRDTPRLEVLEAKFDAYILDGIPELKRLGYNPTLFLEMVKNSGSVVGATKRLLADPRHTSYGFQRLYDLRRLDASVEYAACLPWFEELFTPDEIYEARSRLLLHDFPLDRRLTDAVARPPAWTAGL